MCMPNTSCHDSTLQPVSSSSQCHHICHIRSVCLSMCLSGFLFSFCALSNSLFLSLVAPSISLFLSQSLSLPQSLSLSQSLSISLNLSHFSLPVHLSFPTIYPPSIYLSFNPICRIHHTFPPFLNVPSILYSTSLTHLIQLCYVSIPKFPSI